MALIKTPEEIETMREGGKLLSDALSAAIDAVRPGVSLPELDAIAEKVIRDGGGEPSFLGYQSYPEDEPFPSTICASVNNEIVHGRADREIVLKEGDIIGLDIGCWYKGLCTDMAATVAVGTISEETQKLLDTTKASLLAGVEAAKVGKTVLDISGAIEDYVKPYGYGVVRSLVGHGVGHKVHEDPQVPNYRNTELKQVDIVEGMCLALEPMLSLGDYPVETADDGWSIVMKDGSLGAHFEVTIAFTKNGTEILTPLPV